MSEFINSLSHRLTALEQKVRAFPGKLDSIVARLDWGKWENLLVRVNNDFNRLLDRLSAPQNIGIPALSLIFDLGSLSFTTITSEDKARWRAAHKSEIRVVIGGERVQVMAASEITDEGEFAVSHRKPIIQQQDYLILTWDQYQKLLCEIRKLISDGAEPS